MGYAHPDYLLDDLSSKQVAEWAAFDRLEPIGDYRMDYMIGQLTSLVHNLSQQIYVKREERQLLNAEDFIPWFDKKDREQKKDNVARSPEEIKRLFKALAKRSSKRRK